MIYGVVNDDITTYTYLKQAYRIHILSYNGRRECKLLVIKYNLVACLCLRTADYVPIYV